MASNSHNSDDYPQNTRHCVLIDGDFGRHELFSNIHPYTLNRIDKLNDASTFKKSTEEAMKLMNDASNIHYHIWYNSSSVEVDEYYKALKLMYPQSVWLRSSIKTVADKDNNENSTEKFITVKSEHEYDYIWIIYGIENHYDKLIEQLKYTHYSKANIFSYCWLENLKCGSNRIEYLLDEIISNVTEQQQIASEVNTNPIETKPTPNIPSWNIEIPFKCTQYGCGRSYEEEESLKRHEAYEHHIALLCPFGLNCQRSKKKYHGVLHLRKHVLLEHAPLYSQPTCFDPECKLEEKKPFSSWKGVLTHILKKHLAAVGIFIESTQLRTKAEGKSKTCGYNACVQSFTTRAKFQCHLVTYHHYPLRCPYNSNCNRVNSGEDDGEGYLGLVELERHIKANHSEQYPEPMCFNSECQKERHFPGWNAVVNHILTKHWLDIK
ncbi:unnamed protein product [Rotaria sp. Silwood2]|nr:unnamed protein product [Rotaria sp. Silwood2]CAF4319981.1 unnamed protein product [Rotaria sp. Silwood2]